LYKQKGIWKSFYTQSIYRNYMSQNKTIYKFIDRKDLLQNRTICKQKHGPINHGLATPRYR